MATLDDVREIGMRMPEVEESTSYGTPALKVRGRLVCRLWGESEHRRDGVDDTEVIAVHCDLEAKDDLIESSNGVLFSTPHYEGHGMMLIRLADSDLEELAGYLEDSYCLRAPKALLRKLDDD